MFCVRRLRSLESNVCRARMAAARAATLPARGPDDHDLAVPWTPHVQHVLTLLSMILLVLSVLLIPMQLHFFIDMPILNLSMQRLPEAVIIVFLTIYSSDTNHLTIMLEIPTAQGPDAPRAAAHRSLHTTHTRIDSHAAHTLAPAPPAPAPPHPLHVRAQHDLPQHPQHALPQRARLAAAAAAHAAAIAAHAAAIAAHATPAAVTAVQTASGLATATTAARRTRLSHVHGRPARLRRGIRG